MFVDFIPLEPIDPKDRMAVIALAKKISLLIDGGLPYSPTTVEEWERTSYPKVYIPEDSVGEWTLCVPGSYGKNDGTWAPLQRQSLAGTDRIDRG